MTLPAQRRLSALATARQVEVSLRADRAARAADRAARAVWLEILALMKRRPAPAEARGQALRLFTALRPALIQAVTGALTDTTAWAEASARWALGRALPRRALLQALTWQYRHGRLREEEAGELDFLSLLGLPAEISNRDLSALLLPAPTAAELHAVIYATDWQTRIGAGTRLASPEVLADTLAVGLAAGKSQQEIARDLLPLVDGVRASARRVARTESLRVAQAAVMKTHEQLGDLVVGYQIHATLDARTRPEHRKRNGTAYYANPAPGQLGYDQMPNPPQEADGTTAWNCRCWLSPILRDSRLVGPDKKIMEAWFQKAGPRRKRVLIGGRRYDELREFLRRDPTYSDCFGPPTGQCL